MSSFLWIGLVNFFIKIELNKNLNVTIVYPTQKISIENFSLFKVIPSCILKFLYHGLIFFYKVGLCYSP